MQTMGLGLGVGPGRALATPPLPGAALWLRSDRGITLATGVSAWADLSGNGFNVTQATGSAQPAFVASDPLFGGISSLAFVSANQQWLQNNSITLTQPNTSYVVCNYSVAGTGIEALDGVSARQIVGKTAVNWQIYAGIAIDAGTPDTNPHVFCAVFTATSALYIDNSQTPVSSGNASTGGITGVLVGGIAGNLFQGHMTEVIMFPGAHTPAQRKIVMSYLGSRSRIATS